MRMFHGALAAAFLIGCVACAEGTSPAMFGPMDLKGGSADATILSEGTIAPMPDVPLLDGQMCHPGEAKCMGSVFLACNAAGSDWMSIPCPAGTTCTPTGCETGVVQDAIEPPPDVVTVPDVATADAPAQDPGVVAKDTIAPVDPGTPPSDPGTPPVDTYVAPDCGKDGPCAADEECCKTLWGSYDCVPLGQCNQPEDCEDDADCDAGLKCCKGLTGSSCREQCWGGGGGSDLPTCESDADCTGGQTCVNLTLTKLCLTTCEADGDCASGACKEVGALGYVLAKVCGCEDDDVCGSDLVCCKVPLVDFKTCLEQCSGN